MIMLWRVILLFGVYSGSSNGKSVGFVWRRLIVDPGHCCCCCCCCGSGWLQNTTAAMGVTVVINEVKPFCHHVRGATPS